MYCSSTFRLQTLQNKQSSFRTCHHNIYTDCWQKELLAHSIFMLKYLYRQYYLVFNGSQNSHPRGICQPSFWSWINHKLSWSSFAQSSESTSGTLRDGSSLRKPPRRVLEVEIPALLTPTSGFFGFLTSPTSRNSKNRFTRLWPNQDSEPFLRLWGTSSNMVSSRLKCKWKIPVRSRRQSSRKLITHTNTPTTPFHF